MVPMELIRAHHQAVRDYADELRRYADDAEAFTLAMSGDPDLSQGTVAMTVKSLQGEIHAYNRLGAACMQNRRDIRAQTLVYWSKSAIRLEPEDINWLFKD